MTRLGWFCVLLPMLSHALASMLVKLASNLAQASRCVWARASLVESCNCKRLIL